MSTRWARFARGWAAALFSTLVATTSHGLAGGGMPHPASIALALAFSGIVCIALTGRRLSTTRTAVSVVLSQAVFHGLFATIGGANGTVVSGGHHTMLLATDAAMATGSHPSLAMWGAHAIAAVVTIAALRGGGRVFWGLAELAARFVRTVVPRLVQAPALVVAPSHPATHVSVSSVVVFLVSALRYRGPPVAAVA